MDLYLILGLAVFPSLIGLIGQTPFESLILPGLLISLVLVGVGYLVMKAIFLSPSEERDLPEIIPGCFRSRTLLYQDN